MSKRNGQRPDTVDEIIAAWAVTRPGLDVSAMEVFGRLHRSFLLYREQIADRFEELGTNVAGFDVMAALRRAPEFRMSAGDLAHQTLVTTGGLTLRVRKLEAAGLVRRTRDTVDNRVVHVQLTDAGRELVDRVADEHFANLARMLDGLTPRAQDDLADQLSLLEASLHAAAPGLEPREA
ncbi:MarR family winged helix-turn-helix transcriptional regulator [Enemella evansiae]|uniref:MarR family winged helix-turn-helix transcriptional regulator n=1 Tax=Enemella evansiae TaxID=2016499 RepID=UPI000B9799B2|nr:MarR family transcriptional regulator [Enemella evansiae]PFG68677.1 DNA-binding MarR family transcriptional regulator [Propionibacteriaceae bacterium ES.041]OYN94034.1 MarR family transcriptional regulator [Enemella evansiae]OYN95321.1 MarR family transcriptional regulator [Enemella evansiae]OYO03423.1 MarR family transcriptional regulator [Enemella evansiae]OYO09844.1 MarR family transcriptional regulator [Enemella evansiae]